MLTYGPTRLTVMTLGTGMMLMLMPRTKTRLTYGPTRVFQVFQVFQMEQVFQG